MNKKQQSVGRKEEQSRQTRNRNRSSEYLCKRKDISEKPGLDGNKEGTRSKTVALATGDLGQSTGTASNIRAT